MNRNKAFNLLTAAFIVTLIGLLVLIALTEMSVGISLFIAFAIAFLFDMAAIMILFKYPYTKEVSQDGFDLDEVRVPRTVLGTTVEILTGALVTAAWVMALKNGQFTTDNGGIDYREIFYSIIGTCVIIFTLWDIYTPRDLENVGKLTNLRQVTLAVRMKRLLAILFALAMFMYCNPATANLTWLWIVLAVITISVFLTFRYLIYKAK